MPNLIASKERQNVNQVNGGYVRDVMKMTEIKNAKPSGAGNGSESGC